MKKSRPAIRMTILSLEEQVSRLNKAITATHKLIQEKEDLIEKFKNQLDEKEKPKDNMYLWPPSG